MIDGSDAFLDMHCGDMNEALVSFTGIEDTTSRIFPVTADICGRTRVANSVETCLMDQLPALASLGIRHLLIDARGRGPRYAREMAALYGEALSVMEAGG